MRKEILLCTVIFSQNLPYLEDFFASVGRQDTSLFDFLIINEDVNITQYSQWLEKTIVLQSVGSPLENRIQMIEYAKNKGYKYILWQDSDDICSNERVSIAKNEIGGFDVLIHDMRLIDKEGELICDSFVGKYFRNKSISFEDIKYKNFIGFGNTMVRVDCIDPSMYITESIKAIDWWIACSLMLEGRNIKYIDKRLSDYRQYDSNLANLKITSIDQVRRQLNIINAHYSGLLDVLLQNKDLENELKQHNDKIELVIKRLSEENIESNLMNLVNRELVVNYVWWEEINNIVREVKL